MAEDVYKKLSKHLSSLGMGYPEKEELIDILRENFNPLEAEVALAIPADRIPFEPVSITIPFMSGIMGFPGMKVCPLILTSPDIFKTIPAHDGPPDGLGEDASRWLAVFAGIAAPTISGLDGPSIVICDP